MHSHGQNRFNGLVLKAFESNVGSSILNNSLTQDGLLWTSVCALTQTTQPVLSM